MNIYAIIILAALVGEYLLNLISNSLNLRHLSPEIPEEFRDTFDAEAYRKSQEYTRVRTKFALLTSLFDLIVLLVFWFAGGFAYLDQLIRSWELHPIITGILFIGILFLLKFMLSLPFSIYSTFVIEERFGFNKTTPRTFITDILKNLMLSVIIGVPVLAGVLAFFQYTGEWAWLYCWALVTLISLFLHFIFPTWILPLFNKFEPIEEGDLKNKIFEYARKVNYSLAGIFIMDGSRRSTKSNAFFTGFGKNKRIALFDTLVNKFSVDELVSVLAHEIGHYKKKHILISILIGIIHTGVVFYLLSIFLTHKGLFEAFYVNEPSLYAGLIFFALLYSPIELVLSIFTHILSRRHEYQADRFAAETIESPDTFISALKKLSVDNLINLTPHPFYVFLNYSHPPVLQRIMAIKNKGAQ